jgi:hypothetical protein
MQYGFFLVIFLAVTCTSKEKKAQFLDQLLSLPVDVTEVKLQRGKLELLGKFMMKGTLGILKNKKVKRKRRELFFWAFFIVERLGENTR